jgi:hypothetical protein
MIRSNDGLGFGYLESKGRGPAVLAQVRAVTPKENPSNLLSLRN